MSTRFIFKTPCMFSKNWMGHHNSLLVRGLSKLIVVLVSLTLYRYLIVFGIQLPR